MLVSRDVKAAHTSTWRGVEITHTALVPQVVLYESEVINEWLEETFPDPPMLPQEPLLRAKVGGHNTPAAACNTVAPRQTCVWHTTAQDAQAHVHRQQQQSCRVWVSDSCTGSSVQDAQGARAQAAATELPGVGV